MPDYRHLREATTADLAGADNAALAEALEPACPRCGRLVLAGSCCPEPIPCPDEDEDHTAPIRAVVRGQMNQPAALPGRPLPRTSRLRGSSTKEQIAALARKLLGGGE